MYDVDMKSWAMSSSNKYNLRKAIGGVVDSFIRIRNFEMTYRGEIDTWDYQWIYARLINRMLIIIPSYNMVSNIGFTGAATHTNISGSKVDNLERYEMSLDYRHPQSFIPSYDFERKITVQKRGMFGCSPIYCIRKILSRFMLLIKGWLYG